MVEKVTCPFLWTERHVSVSVDGCVGTGSSSPAGKDLDVRVDKCDLNVSQDWLFWLIKGNNIGGYSKEHGQQVVESCCPDLFTRQAWTVA